MRDGDPAALAGLCERRGAAVFAYCRQVAGDADALVATAETFASFRAAVVAAPDLNALNPGVLLVGAMRQAAARFASLQAPPGMCAEVPSLLAARADRVISPVDAVRLDSHVDGCWACRAPLQRFAAAERAYRDPPDGVLPEPVAAALVAAMTAAAPVRDALVGPPAPATNGNGLHGPPAAIAPPPPAAPAGDPDATAVYDVARSFDAEDALAARPDPLADARREQQVRARRRRRARPLRTPGGLPVSVILPAAIVVIAIVVVLLIAGVFGGREPASSSISDPAAAPSSATSRPQVVVIPDAEQASGDEVELAKARARAERRRERAASAPPAADEAPAASATPATTPPAAPAADDDDRGGDATDGTEAPAGTGDATGGTPRVDGDDGATGSEQLPPADGTTSVPDLAPPAEPAIPPG